MKIKITMVSGKNYKFDNKKYKSLEKWIDGNFKNKMIENKPFKRCKNYTLAREQSLNRFNNCFLVQRENGEYELRGCFDCNGHNTRCEVYQELNKESEDGQKR